MNWIQSASSRAFYRSLTRVPEKPCGPILADVGTDRPLFFSNGVFHASRPRPRQGGQSPPTMIANEVADSGVAFSPERILSPCCRRQRCGGGRRPAYYLLRGRWQFSMTQATHFMEGRQVIALIARPLASGLLSRKLRLPEKRPAPGGVRQASRSQTPTNDQHHQHHHQRACKRAKSAPAAADSHLSDAQH